MSFNNKYNTRHSTGRYNTPGQFVSAGEMGKLNQNQPLFGASAAPPQPQRVPAKAPPLPPQPAQPPANTQNLQPVALQAEDAEMKDEPASGDGSGKPFWMRSKLAGVKKVSNKERRRRQNEHLRRLLTPKNALMVLNEMLPGEQLANQFKVEPASQYGGAQPGFGGGPFYKPHSFCADLTLAGSTYKGYGDNKLTARNAAAEQAIRDLIIKKMNKAFSADAASTGSGGGGAADSAEEGEEALPMIQLASFALHKLFAEWEYEGHKVPQLRGAGSVSESGAEVGAAPRPPPARKELPLNAPSMHPCMLLTYMWPHPEYRAIAVEGDRPQNMIFTMGVDVNGSTYIGKASNKKEARKQAARSACVALFNVQFDENPTANAPVVKTE